MSSIATVHALQFTAFQHLCHAVNAHRYLSRVFRGRLLAVFVLSLSSGQAIEQRLHRYALGLCMHLQSEHITVMCCCICVLQLSMPELTARHDVLNGHHLLCSMQPKSFLLSEDISTCGHCLLQIMQQTAWLQCLLHRQLLFHNLVDALRYLSRVVQECLSIMLLLSLLACQAILQLCPQLRCVPYGYTCTFNQSLLCVKLLLLGSRAVHYTWDRPC